ncbi:MAG: hypothetical protein PHD29_05875 [bacterium]|nr:hypothetical protein [bacterium]
MANSRFGVALRACGLTLASLPTGRQLFFFLFGGGKIFKRLCSYQKTNSASA